MPSSGEDEADAGIARAKAWRSAYLFVVLGVVVTVAVTRSIALVALIPFLLLILDRVRLAREGGLMNREVRRAPPRKVRVASTPKTG